MGQQTFGGLLVEGFGISQCAGLGREKIQKESGEHDDDDDDDDDDEKKIREKEKRGSFSLSLYFLFLFPFNTFCDVPNASGIPSGQTCIHFKSSKLLKPLFLGVDPTAGKVVKLACAAVHLLCE